MSLFAFILFKRQFTTISTWKTFLSVSLFCWKLQISCFFVKFIKRSKKIAFMHEKFKSQSYRLLNLKFYFYLSHVRYKNNFSDFSLKCNTRKNLSYVWFRIRNVFSLSFIVLCFMLRYALSFYAFSKFSLSTFTLTGFWLEEIFCISLNLVLTASRFWIKSLRDFYVHRLCDFYIGIVCSSF